MKKANTLLILAFLIISLSNCQSTNINQLSENASCQVEVVAKDFQETVFPKQQGAVTDLEAVFSIEEREKLTRIIAEFEKRTTNEIAIVTVNSIGNYKDFDQYAIDLSNSWQVGKLEKDNGLTIVLSKELRKIRISTRPGTQKILTDARCKAIIEETIIPEFKNNTYYAAVEKGLLELIKYWR